MQEQQLPDGAPRTQGGGSPARSVKAPPSSSRMFASYLTDIEQLLDEERWDAALSESFELPRIAVALADPQLRCSPEQARTWCEEWIRPPRAEHDAHGLDFEQLARAVGERVAKLAASEAVPMRALRRLQLRRHVRTLPRGFNGWHSDNLAPEETASAEMCSALVEAARRWYARSACHDVTVQANLARLAVLR